MQRQNRSALTRSPPGALRPLRTSALKLNAKNETKAEQAARTQPKRLHKSEENLRNGQVASTITGDDTMQQQSRGIRGGKSSPIAAARPHQFLCKSHCNSHQGCKGRPNHHHSSHETTQKIDKATSESLNR
ncbi:hypothetical protein V6N13_074184 [Hibiscus sabdariffa]|uniref:Uncharacterized protein n=1 Tax=Hibiscus sabdariffa TaxID=183260 RepID=A0ABR2U7X1_9ROSI